MNAATASTPWYRHLWPWIIIAILTCSVTLSLTMVSIAVNNPDNLVTDNYYEAGKGINRSLDREQFAQTLQLRATLRLDELTGEAELRLSGHSRPERLELNLISPTQPGKDRRVFLIRSTSDGERYIGQLQDEVRGRRFVELLGTEGGRTWRLFEEELVGPDRDLRLGDEPLQGAQQSTSP
ncbi:FixH family protein [Pseudomonas sp. JDS28PS106]|uniref:FixH family protein n=1 Tax=Pseudomonas sp. JDS28PS106 TaxID=2497235 RepID=UPI002FD6F253